MFYELQPSSGSITNAGATVAERPFQGRVKTSWKESGFSPRSHNAGPWDTFSIRNLGLRINRRMAREFESDSRKIRQTSSTTVTRAINLDPDDWTPIQKQALENWSLVLALIPDLARWTPLEKNQLIKIIRAKSAASEMSYLHQTQRHPRLRTELLRLGSQ